jgi:hypothetical protein
MLIFHVRCSDINISAFGCKETILRIALFGLRTNKPKQETSRSQAQDSLAPERMIAARLNAGLHCGTSGEIARALAPSNRSGGENLRHGLPPGSAALSIAAEGSGVKFQASGIALIMPSACI